MHPRIEADHLDAGLLPTVEVATRTEPHLVEPVLRAIQAAIVDCSVTAAQTFAGRIYDRKGVENCVTAFGDAPNPRYSSERDDFYLQIGIRVPRHANAAVLDEIRTVEAMSNEQLLREALDRLAEAKARTADAQDSEARIQAEIERLSQRPKEENQ
jgi:hypothetical protein